MARLNIEDQFWIEIGPVARQLGEDMAIGQAMRLFRVAQQRAKQGQIVTEEDWQIHGFSDALVPVFAKKVEGGFEVQGSKKHFGWLKDRAESGRRGGEKSGEVRRNKINYLTEAKRSKRKQTEPSYSYSPSYSSSKEELILSSELHWLGELWNQHCGQKLSKIKKTSTHMKNINLRLKEESESVYWEDVIKRVAKSHFLTGQVKGSEFKASFSWLIARGKDGALNHVKIHDGNYENKNGQGFSAGAEVEHNSAMNDQQRALGFTDEEMGNG